MRVAVLEQEIKDKDQLMRRTKEVLEATQQQKVRAATLCICCVNVGRKNHLLNYSKDTWPTPAD